MCRSSKFKTPAVGHSNRPWRTKSKLEERNLAAISTCAGLLGHNSSYPSDRSSFPWRLVPPRQSGRLLPSCCSYSPLVTCVACPWLNSVFHNAVRLQHAQLVTQTSRQEVGYAVVFTEVRVLTQEVFNDIGNAHPLICGSSQESLKTKRPDGVYAGRGVSMALSVRLTLISLTLSKSRALSRSLAQRGQNAPGSFHPFVRCIKDT